MSDLQQLRREVAEERGLPVAAESFLTGTTLTELAASAELLAELLAAREAPPAGARAGKARQQQALIETLHPRPDPPRDQQGRFASTGLMVAPGRPRRRRPTPPASTDS